MRIEVLGCSGGVGPGLRTTTLRLGETALLDAGTGVGDLSLAAMTALRDVFLTHAHLDHVAGLAFLADNLHDRIAQPLRVHAPAETLAALREHLFNWTLWPDFTQLPSVEQPTLQWRPLGEPVQVGAARITPLPVLHTVPATGYVVEGPAATLAFSGDTWSHAPMWEALAALPRLDHLVVEVAFGDEAAGLGELSRHYTPSLLASDLAQLGARRPKLWLSHHKPGSEAEIERQCRALLDGWDYSHLRRGDIIEI